MSLARKDKNLSNKLSSTAVHAYNKAFLLLGHPVNIRRKYD